MNLKNSGNHRKLGNRVRWSQGRERAPHSCDTMVQQAVVGERMAGSTDPAARTTGATDAGGRTVEDVTFFADKREGGM